MTEPREDIALELARKICRELYDRFVMGGWEPQDAHEQVAALLRLHVCPESSTAVRCSFCHINFHIPAGVFWMLGGIVSGAVVVRVAYEIMLGVGKMFGWR